MEIQGVTKARVTKARESKLAINQKRDVLLILSLR